VVCPACGESWESGDVGTSDAGVGNGDIYGLGSTHGYGGIIHHPDIYGVFESFEVCDALGVSGLSEEFSGVQDDDNGGGEDCEDGDYNEEFHQGETFRFAEPREHI